MISLRKKIIFQLILGDLAIMNSALAATLLLRDSGHFINQFIRHLPSFAIVFTVWLLIFYANGFLNPRLPLDKLIFLKAFAKSVLVSAAVAIAFFYLAPTQINPRLNLFFVTAIFSFLFYLWRNIFYLSQGGKKFREKIGFVGLNEETIEILDKISQHHNSAYQVQFILLNKASHPLEKKLPKNIKIYHGLSSLNRLVSQIYLDKLIIAMNPETNPVLSKELYHASSNIDFVYFPDFYEQVAQKIPLQMINRLWIRNSLSEKNYDFLKRLIDILLALAGGIILLILFPFLLLAYLVTDGLPIFFSQTRMAHAGKKFKIHKLRTMVKYAERERPLWAEENDSRVTSLGKFLRKSYIDELPQFLNILKGEMSVVGPRPERPEFVKTLEKEVPFYHIRHSVKPGVTGWAQINSFYARSVNDSIEKTKYDLYYVKNRGLLFDFSIIFKTILMVFSKRKKQNY